jgi:gliding motility-associated protein GldM
MPLSIDIPKPSDHNPTGDWSVGNFEHMPAVAALALFSKYQNDVRSSENMVIKKLSELAHARDLKFDTMAAVAVPRTTYALKGDKIEAQIILAAFNKTNKPKVSIAQGGGQSKDAVNGVISWETIADGVGLQTVKGRVQLETAEQGTISRDWSFDYMVGTTGASLQLDKMNVFYIGVKNPVTVSAAGYALEDVYLSCPAGVTAEANPTEKGKFDITCALAAKGNINVDIMAKSKEKDGAAKKVASIPIRVKVIPDPVAYVLDKKDGSMPTSLFRDGALGPRAVLEKFEFEAKFVITEFKFSMIPKKGGEYIGPYTVSKPAGGALFTDSKEIEKVKSNCKPGDRIFIEQIKGKGPDGGTRSLNPIILSLN